MKRVYKSDPPQELVDFTQNNPNASWEAMCNDAFGGLDAARMCRDQAILDQNGLCAYCEMEVSSDKPRNRRIEHFHPKSDVTESHNWSLDWINMLAVCDGGSESSHEIKVTHPLPENLSCDAHKDRLTQNKELPLSCEGYILNPLKIPPFPNLFAFNKGTGHLKPDDTACSNVKLPECVFNSTTELVNNTITVLNLNCERLAEKRRRIVVDIDRNKKRLRDRGVPLTDAPKKLLERYFSTKWPEFFTTLRCCLGDAAEEYLVSIDYNG